MFGVTSGIELAQMARGQISGMQCFKNIATNAAGALGAMTGMVIGSAIPVVGTTIGGIAGGIIGGMAAGSAAKKKLDKHIKDDLTIKQELFSDHMLSMAMLFKFTQSEMSVFQKIVESIISRDPKFFAKTINIKEVIPSSNAVLKPIAALIIKKRPKVSGAVLDMAVSEAARQIIDAEIIE